MDMPQTNALYDQISKLELKTLELNLFGHEAKLQATLWDRTPHSADTSLLGYLGPVLSQISTHRKLQQQQQQQQQQSQQGKHWSPPPAGPELEIVHLKSAQEANTCKDEALDMHIVPICKSLPREP